MLFLLALKWNLEEKAFSSVKTKTNSNFAVKLAERVTLECAGEHFLWQGFGCLFSKKYLGRHWIRDQMG